MPTSKILVAVSTPWAGEKLFQTVSQLSANHNAPVIVVHVAKPTEQDDTPQDTQQRGEQTVTTLASKLTDAGITTESLMLYGDDVARAVVNAAEEKQATLILIGLSGKGTVARWLGGDVPMQIIRQANMPVLVIPPEWSGSI